MFELSKATRPKERHAIATFISGIRPIYLSNNNFIKQREILAFLNRNGEWPFAVDGAQPFNDSVAGMWNTYGNAVLIGETFGDYVEHLAANKADQMVIQKEVNETPDLLRGARRAVTAGTVRMTEILINDEWIFSILPERDPRKNWVSVERRKQAAAFALSDPPRLFRECPAIHADELRYQFSVHGDRRIDKNHATDTQHVIGPLAYCDFFLTVDKGLSIFIAWCNEHGSFPCAQIARLGEIKHRI